MQKPSTLTRLTFFLCCCVGAADAAVHPDIDYGVAATIQFSLYAADGSYDIDETDSGTDVVIFCDQDSGTVSTNDYVDEGKHYTVTLTASETQCAEITLEIDATIDENVHIRTRGNASASYLYMPSNVLAVEGTDPTDTIRDAIMQYAIDNGLTFEEIVCHSAAVLFGRSAFTAGSPDENVFSDAGNNDVRVTIEYGSDSGDRTSVTLSNTDCGSN